MPADFARAGQRRKAAFRPDALICLAVQICAAPMAIRRKSFYGPAVQASHST
jgi:hypothetical protein